MRDIHGNEVPGCVERFALELGTPESMIGRDNYQEFTFDSNGTLAKLKAQFGWRHETQPDGDVVVYMRNSFKNNGVVYTFVPKDKFSLFAKVMGYTHTPEELTSFLDIKMAPPIILKDNLGNN
jgi:hypothetical protein